MNANKMKAEILEKCWNNNLKSFVNTWNGNQVFFLKIYFMEKQLLNRWMLIYYYFPN